MTTLAGRPNTALLVIDVQHGVVAGAVRRDEVVANIAALVARARTADVPVVWVSHHDEEGLVRGSDPWRIVDELDPDDAEPLVEKRYGDAFEETTLEQVIAHTNLYWTYQEAPGRRAGTVTADEVDFAAPAA